MKARDRQEAWKNSLRENFCVEQLVLSSQSPPSSLIRRIRVSGADLVRGSRPACSAPHTTAAGQSGHAGNLSELHCLHCQESTWDTALLPCRLGQPIHSYTGHITILEHMPGGICLFPCPCLHPASSRPCFHPPRQVGRLVSPGLMLLRQGLVTQSRLSLNLLSPWLCLLSVALTGVHPHTQMWLPYLMVTPCAFSKTIFTCHFSCSGAYHSSPSSY